MILRGTVFSQTMEMDSGITVIAPNDFTGRAPYRIAYLLHGRSGNSDSWADYSMLPFYALSGKTVYVLPEVGRSMYADMRYGLQYFTYVADELPALVGRLFNISSKREDTAVIGASMGGYGALKIALSRPDRFGMCGAISSACLFLREGLEQMRQGRGNPEFVAMLGQKTFDDFDAAFGEDLAYSPEMDVVALADTVADAADKPEMYAACGTNDPFLQDNRRY